MQKLCTYANQHIYKLLCSFVEKIVQRMSIINYILQLMHKVLTKGILHMTKSKILWLGQIYLNLFTSLPRLDTNKNYDH